jgi:DNA-binding transcriptional regulator YhcF (GntR family)
LRHVDKNRLSVFGRTAGQPLLSAHTHPTAGSRLPSLRLCANERGVSVTTVVAAYDHLLAQGLVVAQKTSGFLVRDVVFDE